MKQEWPQVKLGEVARPVSRPVVVEPGKAYRTLGVKWWGEGAYERESIDGSQTAAKTLSLVKKDDLIINKIWVRHGSTAVVDDKVDGCCGSGEFPTFELDRRQVIPGWMHWQTKTRKFWDRCDALSRGTSGKNRIRPELFLTIQIPLPSLKEQQRIVNRISEVAGKVSEAQRLRCDTLRAKDHLWQTAARMVLEKKDTQARPLGEVVSVRGGGTPSKGNPLFWEGSIPWISPKDMKVREISDAIDHISKEATQHSPAKLIAPGAVLVVIRGMILVHTVPSAVLQVPATINQDMKALIPSGDILPEYLCRVMWAFNDRFLAQVEKSTHDTRKLETHRLLEVLIPVPTLARQRELVTQLDALSLKTDSFKQLQSATADELDALLPSILDRAFKGEL